MRVPIFKLKTEDRKLRKELLLSVEKVLIHGKLILGPEVEELEKKIAKIANKKYAVSLASGSSALYLALKALNIGKGDEVITTPLTWIITANSIAETGATPVFVDINDDFNINPDLIEKKISKKTKAIMPVHFTGKMCDMGKISKIAKKYNLHIIEDAAQAFGAKRDGIDVGEKSAIGCFSFNSMKVLSSYGEAGGIVTDDKALYKKIKILRYSGTLSDPNKIVTNEAVYCSLNHKIDTIQAAMILVNLKYLPSKMERRYAIAKKYNKYLSKYVECPDLNLRDTHALYTYAIKTKYRNSLMDYLNKNNIETKIYHKPLVPDAPYFINRKSNNIPNAKKILKEILSIPSHEKLTEKQVDHVIEKICSFFNRKF